MPSGIGTVFIDGYTEIDVEKGVTIEKGGIRKDSVANCLSTDFENYIEKLYNTKNAYHKIEDNAKVKGIDLAHNVEVKLSDLSNINENYIKQNCVLNKLELMFCLFFYYEKYIPSKELFILKLKEADKFIDNFQYCKNVYNILSRENNLTDENRTWIKGILKNILDKIEINDENIVKIQNYCKQYEMPSIRKEKEDELFFYIQDYVVSKLQEFVNTDNLNPHTITDFLFGSLKLFKRYSDIISRIIDNSNDRYLYECIITNPNIVAWNSMVSLINDKDAFYKSLRYLYSKLPNEQKEYYKTDFFDKHPEILEEKDNK